MVYARHEGVDEGRLTDLRKSVVNAHSLAALASTLGLGDHLLLGNGEDAEGGRRKVSILSDALEAVLGALYLDAGPTEARRIVGELLEGPVAAAVESLDRLDPKTRLQELAARGGFGAVAYAVTGEGPDHAKVFTATVSVGDSVRGSGTGPTKKAAEQAAADVACESLRVDDGR
jgi:ribonuclease-3